ncbi:MAG: DUF2341 domain-containing protein, partial [Acidimicrobiia bacterium]
MLLTPQLALAAPPLASPDGYSVVQDGSLIVDWWDADWTKRRKIVFDNSLQGTDLDEFPVLVTIPGASFDYLQTQNLGQDLRFVDATGEPLSHEIEVWNELGDSYVWVKVPRVDALSTTDSIWMYYGNPVALDRQDAAGVWSNGYVGVWHFDEDPSGGAGSIRDSTSYANHGDPYNMDASNLQPGAIGTGLSFPGTTPNPDYIRVASSGVDELSITGTQLTLEAWAQQTGDSGDWSIIVGRQLGSGSGDSFALFGDLAFPDRLAMVGPDNFTSPPASMPLNQWRYVAGVRDGTDLTLYSAGSQVAQLTGLGSSIATDVNDITIGAEENDGTANPAEPWLGLLDEVRISDVGRSADWVRAQNLSMTGVFAALDPEESAPALEGVLGNDNDPEDDPLTAILVSGPSQALGFTFRDDGTFIYTPNPGYSGPDSFDYKVNDGTGDSGTVTATIAVVGGISGRVFEDIDGNLLEGAEAIADADNPVVVGATVHVYADAGTPDVPDAADTAVPGSPFTTGPAGIFTTGALADGKYWVVVDSKTVPASQEPAEPQANIWAEQTYGWIGALCADGTGGTGGPSGSSACFGGRRASQSDNLTTWHSGAEHIALANISGGFAVPNVDFGFSFNVVTNALAGDGQDDDGGAAGRIVQGSLRQFMTNANALAGANSMRFVPAAPVNDTSWWEIKVSQALPAVTGAGTVIDGTAFQLSDGVTVRDENPGTTGYNAANDKTVGVDDVPLPVIDRPELEIEADRTIVNPVETGIQGDANGLEVRDLAIYAFGDTGIANTDSNIGIGPSGGSDYTGVVIERNLIGSGAGDFVGPIILGTGAGITLETTNGAIVRDNLIGFTDGRTIDNITATGTLVQGNELTTVDEDVADF